MSYLIIDGAQGEGGGQVLRMALTLSILTKQPIEIVNIRATGRNQGCFGNTDFGNGCQRNM